MLQGIAESCLYATNLEETERFYRDVLDLEVVMKERGRHVFFRCGNDMLLIFNPEHTAHTQTEVNGKPVPLHGATGAGHLAFSVSSEAYESVRDELTSRGVAIESEIDWPNKSRSFYFRDPADNSLEVITTNMWNE